ncbi:MAG: hypothetical protein AVDCRST_MAG93-7190 [uncultured Chloroflexia bacterium]|uniref:Uncharacterized protein n=1 Tax=uncultured Chloroflexia bacterium TaxID=1672391 RepID=A0A6J4M918_9CHLR|nr:MAG: hypothetical protein AVDCRST_MAG93-7190 [uncultured Chloroflexia bacterium]
MKLTHSYDACDGVTEEPGSSLVWTLPTVGHKMPFSSTQRED